MHPFSTTENIRKPYGFLIFLRGRKRVHWERMEWVNQTSGCLNVNSDSLARVQLHSLDTNHAVPKAFDTKVTGNLVTILGP